MHSIGFVMKLYSDLFFKSLIKHFEIKMQVLKEPA